METLSFKTRKEANEFLRSTPGLIDNGNTFTPRGNYYLSHREYARPCYMVGCSKGVYVIRVHYFYYEGTYNRPENGIMDADTFFNRFPQHNDSLSA